MKTIGRKIAGDVLEWEVGDYLVKQVADAIDTAIDQEREACAKLMDDLEEMADISAKTFYVLVENGNTDAVADVARHERRSFTFREAAAAIRARNPSSQESA